jgi:hypothetical protein
LNCISFFVANKFNLTRYFFFAVAICIIIKRSAFLYGASFWVKVEKRKSEREVRALEELGYAKIIF